MASRTRTSAVAGYAAMLRRASATEPELVARVGQCGGADCGWVFLDAGRGRARRWCDSRDCGNVARARAFSPRQRAGS